eukprot:208370-Prorocentrum_lima.AAC.1
MSQAVLSKSSSPRRDSTANLRLSVKTRVMSKLTTFHQMSDEVLGPQRAQRGPLLQDPTCT